MPQRLQGQSNQAIEDDVADERPGYGDGKVVVPADQRDRASQANETHEFLAMEGGKRRPEQFGPASRNHKTCQRPASNSIFHSATPTAPSPADSQLPAAPPANTVKAAMPDGTTWSSGPTIEVKDGGARWTNEGGGSGHPRTGTPNSSPFLRRTVLHQWNEVEGLVRLQKPEESNVEVSPAGKLNEIDIPIGEVTFRF